MRVHETRLHTAIAKSPQISDEPIELVPPRQVAKELHSTEGTLATWRSTKRVDLPYIKVGSKVLYLRSGVEEFKRKLIQSQSGAEV